MVCKDCESKLTKVAAADPFKAKNQQLTGVADKGKVKSENKLLQKNRYHPYGSIEKCLQCKTALHQPKAKYCQPCSYKKGICSMCGKSILDTKNYRQSAI